jgi:threonine aldolase
MRSVPLRDYLDTRLDDISRELRTHLEDVSRELTTHINHHGELHQQESAHVEQQARELINQVRRENELRSDSMATAIAKSEAAIEHRFESVNEFRASLSDQTAQQLSRNEYHAAHDVLIERVNDLIARMVTLEASSAGRMDQRKNTGQLYAYAVAGLSFLVSVVILANALTGNGAM